MKSRPYLTGATFIMVFFTHFGFRVWHTLHLASHWAHNTSFGQLVRFYFLRLDFFMGLSYATALAFTVYAFTMFLSNRTSGSRGLVAGISLSAVLYWGGCFLIGCCGSPMLPIYLGLFGSAFLGFAKPLVFVVTVVSVAIGIWWMKRRVCIVCDTSHYDCKAPKYIAGDVSGTSENANNKAANL